MRKVRLETVRLRDNEIGLLNTTGIREVVVTIRLADGADDIDSGELISKIKELYVSYCETAIRRIKGDDE